MKKYLFLICFIIIFGFAILSDGTKYAYAGGFIIALFFCTNLIKNIYSYNESRRQIPDDYINFKRDNVANTISAIALLLLNAHKDVVGIKNTEDLILIIALYTAVGTQLLIAIFCIPKLSTEGFICSSGKLIGFNQIKNITSKSGMFMSYKQLTVQCEENSEIFKAHFLDYEDIKKYVQTYGNIVIEEKEN